MEPQWLQWAKRLQAIGQNGLTFTKDPFDIERYEAIREIALEIMAEGAATNITQLLLKNAKTTKKGFGYV